MFHGGTLQHAPASTGIPQERMPERFVERDVVVPVHLKQEETVKEILAIRKHIHERTVEQMVAFPVSHIKDAPVAFLVLQIRTGDAASATGAHPEYIHTPIVDECIGDLTVDVPVPFRPVRTSCL